ncbi:hypothetical protein BU24DRAFT_105594 [Aaosphaeria arxii CBS 175.79]|uniref:Pentatricopeptide repeat protein n=1 Tax=Aaosphaeria arxii CBS 175.79 TaxID=1450172 RepID=A0A6A5Y2K8_9PLEO|nr:uncharacterized protein BU24DRAFT_105594 [Aaosphaeria arxii CBS 175.79]KAF2018814.1 hypothetical protein BU24DRAFT_105594 [Aaosphaeria arxii CBS 175.79]
MQALWSQATRNLGTCRGTSCVPRATAIAQRATANSLQRPRLIEIPTSTFIYTAIFAAGIAIDGRAKQARNRQWDNAFANLQSETEESSLPGLGPEENEIEINLNPTGHMRLEEILRDGVDLSMVTQTIGVNITQDSSAHEHSKDAEPSQAPIDLWEILRFDSRWPGAPLLEWPVNTGLKAVRHHLPPQSLWAYDHMRRTALRRRQTSKKLAIQEVSVGLLIRSLISKTRAHEVDDNIIMDNAPSLMEVLRTGQDTHQDYMHTIEGLEKALAELQVTSAERIATSEEMRTKHHLAFSGLPQYQEDSDGDFHSIRKNMNASLKQIFQQKDQVQDPKALAVATLKISHNLLISSAAPDVQTFNLLVSGFSRWKAPKLVDRVLEALETCKIRHNEVTCANVLHHYAKYGEADKFSYFVSKMRGFGDALTLARPDININEAGQQRLVRQGSKVFQKIHPSPLVFHSLMFGALRFAGFERSMDIYYEMKEDGWGLDVLGLTHFLVDCIKRKDFNGGLYIWNEISYIKDGAKKSHVAKAYANMLSLCSVAGQTAAFNSLLKELVHYGFDRKQIVSNALDMAKRVSGTNEVHVPAFTADNILIAMTDFMLDRPPPLDTPDASPDKPEASSKSGDAELESALELEASLETSEPLPESSEETQDPEELWQAWLKHELGMRRRVSDAESKEPE